MQTITIELRLPDELVHKINALYEVVVGDVEARDVQGGDAQLVPKPHQPAPAPNQSGQLEQLEAILRDLREISNVKTVKDLLARHGASKLSALPVEMYGEVVTEAYQMIADIKHGGNKQ